MNAQPQLIRYEAARAALAEASRVDEVKTIRDKARAMQVYAEQAKDRALMEHATEIRMRAEIRAGELLAEMKQRGDRHQGKALKGSRVATPTQQPKLSDLGINKSQSSRWQKLAALSTEQQEEKIALAKRRAEAAIDGNARSANKPSGPKPRRAIGPIDRCTMAVRATILEIMRESAPAEWDELFVALRDEIDDLEKLAKRKQGDGHNT